MIIKKKDNQGEIEVVKKRAEDLKVPFIDLTGKEIPVEVLKEIPEEAAAFYRFIPLARQENVLEIGMIDPGDLKAKEALRFITRQSGLETKLFIISPADFKNVLKQYRTLRGEVSKALEELAKELEAEERVKPLKGKAEEIAKQIVAEAPVTKIVAVILRHAIEDRASDIHIEPVEAQVKVRFRVDGVLYTGLLLPQEIQAAIISRIKILSNLKIDETRIPQDGRFHTVITGQKTDFRVSTFPTVGGEKAVLRVLDPTVGLRSFSELGIRDYNLEILEKAIKQPFGMILLTGPTGSGKTTTLYAILNQLNREGVNIVSLEDPVEYYIKGINQSQIKPEIDYTFASGLRHILRQDPDVIMVGEIRDKETAGLAIHAALTGHILLSTLHTNNALGVIPRLVDMGIGSFLLPTSLNLAIAQRLVRRLCEKCKKEIIAPPRVIKIIEEELAKLSPTQRKAFPLEKPLKIYRPVGCKFCGNKGTKDRIALFEMLMMTPQLEEIINKELTETRIKEEAQRQGMITMRQDGISKVLQGLISFEEMLRVVEE
ncbi:MAG: type II/IV secretion system protein [Candidatus Portnoybacteria bacterium]|nr:type II/IV secretion system protein [Candidatus Portnoybacteria bacterium]